MSEGDISLMDRDALRERALQLEDTVSQLQFQCNKADLEKGCLVNELERLKQVKNDMDNVRNSEIQELRNALQVSRDELARRKGDTRVIEELRAALQKAEHDKQMLTLDNQGTAELRRQVQRLSDEGSDWDSRRRELEREVEEQRASGAMLRKQIAEMGEAQRECRVLKDKLDSSEMEASKLRLQLSSLQNQPAPQRTDDTQSDLVELRTEKANLLNKLSDLQQRNIELESKVNDMDAKQTAMDTIQQHADKQNKLITDREKERKKLQIALEQQTQSGKALKEELEATRKERDSASTELASVRQYKQQFMDLEESHYKLQREYKQFVGVHEELSAKHELMVKEREKMNLEMLSLQEHKAKLLGSQEKLQESATAELMQLRSKLLKAEGEGTLLKREVQQLTEQLEKTRASLDEASLMAQRVWEPKVEQVKKELNERIVLLTNELKQNQQTSHQVLSVMDKKDQMVAEKEKEVKALQSNIESLRLELANRASEISHSSYEIDNTRRLCQGEIDNIKQLCEQELYGLRSHYEDQLEDMRHQKAFMQKEHQALEMQIRALKEQHSMALERSSAKLKPPMPSTRPSWLNSPSLFSSVSGSRANSNGGSPTYSTTSLQSFKSAKPISLSPVPPPRETSSAPTVLDSIESPSVGALNTSSNFIRFNNRPTLAQIHQMAISIVDSVNVQSPTKKSLPPLSTFAREERSYRND